MLSLIHKKSLYRYTVTHVMNYSTDTEPGYTGSSVLNSEGENKKAIKEIQDKLNELAPSMHNSINLTTIKDLELRVSELEEKVEKILNNLESKKN